MLTRQEHYRFLVFSPPNWSTWNYTVDSVDIKKIRYIILEVAEYTVYDRIIIHHPWKNRSYIPCLSLLVCIWVCLKIVYPYTQWFCWSLSLLNGYNWGYTPFSDIPIWSFLGNFIVPFLGRQPLLNASWNLAAHIAVCIRLCPLPRTFPLRSAVQIEICQGAVVLHCKQWACAAYRYLYSSLFFCSHFLFPRLGANGFWAAQLPSPPHPPGSHLEGLSESIHTARIRDELDPLHASRTLKGYAPVRKYGPK